MNRSRILTTNAARLRRNARPLALAALGAAALTVPAVAPAPAEAAVKEFPQEVRHLNGFWANEVVPGCRCPDSHPFLENRSYAPFGTSLPRGVSVNQERDPWPIGVSITAVKVVGTGRGSGYNQNAWVLGTASHPSLGWSSATNWTGGDQWYQVVLHCSTSQDDGYHDFLGPSEVVTHLVP
jgi:hypothetical protein